MTQPATDQSALLSEARQAVENLNRMKTERGQLDLEEKQLRRQLDAERKAAEDSIALTVKKRREEINSSYDKEIAKGQDRLRRARQKREKAKNQGMRERIAEETSALHAHNRELRLKLRSLLQKERLPRFCGSTWYYALYMPRTLKEVGMLILFILFFFAALPWGIYLLIGETVRKSWMLIVIYLLDILGAGGLYLAVANHTKVGHLEAVRQGRLIRDTIYANQKKIRLITNTIRRDRNEAIYDLEKYDDEIARTEQELAEITRKKQEALSTFDSVTRNIISDEIWNNSKDKIDYLQEEQAKREQRLEAADQQIKSLSLEITDRYESYIGKEFMQPERLEELSRLIRSGQAANLSDAVSQYKAGRNAPREE